MHMHSRKLSGSRSERRRFLQKRKNEITSSDKRDLDEIIEEAVNATL